MKIVYISDNKLFLCSDGKIKELNSEKASQYRENMIQINHRNEWKHSGTGAKFTGAYRPTPSDDAVLVRINGIAKNDTGIIYTADLGGMGGIYGKNVTSDKAPEDHIFASMDMSIGEIDIKDGRIAAIADGHLAVFEKDGSFREIIDGDTYESDPFWSATDGRIFCSSAGYARDSVGMVAAEAPRSILSIDLDAGEMNELYSDEKSDLLKPKNDSSGSFYYIRQPYKQQGPEKEPLWKDILLFPFRLLKAILGFLNAFSVLFGGSSLRGGNPQNGDIKSKQRSERDIYFEGRLIEAEKNEKENAAAGDKNPGIISRSRVLVKVDADGKETVIKKGVLDYALLDDGSIICSNGSQLIHISEGNENVIAKAKLAHSICEVKE